MALTEAIQRLPKDSVIGSAKAAIARRGTQAHNIAKAAARKLLTLVYSGLRDGQIRALAKPGQPSRRLGKLCPLRLTRQSPQP